MSAGRMTTAQQQRLISIGIVGCGGQCQGGLCPAAQRQTEDAQGHAEVWRQRCEDEKLPARIQGTEPHDGKVDRRILHLDTPGRLVHIQGEQGAPRHPEGDDQRKGHGVARIGQVLRQGGRVLLVVDGGARSQSCLHNKYVRVVVQQRDDTGP